MSVLMKVLLAWWLMFIAFLLLVPFGIVKDKTLSFSNDSCKASFISATSEGALNGDVPGG